MAGEELWRIGEARRKELGLRALERPRLAVRPARLAAIAGGPGGRPGAEDVAEDAVGNGAVDADDAEDAAEDAAGDGADGLLIENLQVERSGRLVLDIPRLFFPAGAVTGVVGANGVGKTTLARAVCRL